MTVSSEMVTVYVTISELTVYILGKLRINKNIMFYCEKVISWIKSDLIVSSFVFRHPSDI